MDTLVRAGAAQKDLDKRNFLSGNVVDNAMREWLDQDDPQPGDLVHRAEAKFHEWTTNGEYIKWKGNEDADRARVLEDCRQALARLEPWLAENVLPHAYQPEARGWAHVQVPDRDGSLIDVELFYAIDILLKRTDSGMFRIIDLKTTKNERYVRGDTLAQLPFYALAISAAFDIPLNQIEQVSFLTPLTPQIEVPVVPGVDDYRHLLQRLTSMAQGISASDMEMRESRDSVCQYQCPVAKSCPRGRTPQADESGRVDFSAVAKSWKV